MAKLKAVYTPDCKQNNIKKAILAAIKSLVFSIALGLVFALISYDFTENGSSIRLLVYLLICIVGSAIFVSNIGHYPNEIYYAASLPFKGVTKVLYLIFGWPFWIPMIISYPYMRAGIKQHQRNDERDHRDIIASVESLAVTPIEERFPEEAYQTLLEYCKKEARISGVSCSEAELLACIENIKQIPQVISIKTDLRDHITISLRISGMAPGHSTAFYLGIYEIDLYPHPYFEFHRIRSGRLSNEQGLPQLDLQVRKQIEDHEPEIKRWLYTGRIDKLTQGVLDAIDLGAAITQMYPHYNIAEHYHKADW